MLKNSVDSIGTIRSAVFLAVFSAGVAALLQLPAFGAQSVMLAWDPSQDPDVTGYCLYCGTASGNYSTRIPVGAVTNASIPGLQEGTTYFFVITASNSSGLESLPSQELSWRMPDVRLDIHVIPTNGMPVSVSITGSGPIPDRWTLKQSLDLRTWTTVVSGTNQPVNVSRNIQNLPALFFRLEGN